MSGLSGLWDQLVDAVCRPPRDSDYTDRDLVGGRKAAFRIGRERYYRQDLEVWPAFAWEALGAWGPGIRAQCSCSRVQLKSTPLDEHVACPVKPYLSALLICSWRMTAARSWRAATTGRASCPPPTAACRPWSTATATLEADGTRRRLSTTFCPVTSRSLRSTARYEDGDDEGEGWGSVVRRRAR